MLIYQASVTAILTLLLLNTLNNLRLLRRPFAAPPTPPVPRASADAPLVSILVPARNEARAIGRCVASLARQDYPHCEILVLDDHSEDQTAAIVAELAARYPHVRLLHGQTLPPGWHGKAFACAQLARAAQGEWLLFADADTVHAPWCVSTTLAVAQQRHAALLTMIPRLVAGSFGEALLLPTALLTFAGVLPLGLVTNHPSPVVAGAFGPFMLFRREAYERLGGHEAVRADIVEDMQLSRLVKRHGGRVVWIDGTALVSARLYHGLREAWRGHAKSAFAAMDYSLPGLLAGLPLAAAFLLAPYGFFAAAALDGHVGSPSHMSTSRQMHPRRLALRPSGRDMSRPYSMGPVSPISARSAVLCVFCSPLALRASRPPRSLRGLRVPLLVPHPARSKSQIS